MTKSLVQAYGQAYIMITQAPPSLPPAIAAFFAAHNTGRMDGFTDLFTEDALVGDEEHEYRGATAIREWIDEAIADYHPNAELTDLSTDGDATVATAQVSGTFPGSPAQLRYRFTLLDDKIAALTISA